jgi:hypothetical protein
VQLTVGFVTLFLLLVLPGIIFRRFYYLGEFSKQVSISEPILNTIAYALIPGVLIQLSLAWLYLILIDSGSEVALSPFYNTVFSGNISTSVSRLLLRDLLSNSFLLYLCAVYSISATLGISLYLLVRNLKLDLKFKILRFKNQWAYIFSGESYRFPKWRKFDMSTRDELAEFKKKFLFPSLDVLVKVSESENILYSGILKDYDVLSKDLSQLRRVYLVDAKRYKRTDDDMKLKDIPGDFLIIDGKDIINLNVQYIFSEPSHAKSTIKSGVWYSVWNICTVILIFLSLPALFIPMPSFSADHYQWIIALPWYQKLYLWLVLGQLYGNIFPYSSKKEGYSFIGWKLYQLRTFFVLVLAFIAWWWIW